MPIRRINYKKGQKQEQSRNDKLTAKILKQAELRDKLGTIEDLPLQTEYPESVFIPAAAEIKAAGSIGRGLLRTVGGLTLSNVGAKDLGRIGNIIDNTLNTKVFTPALGFVGGLGGYALGSGLINATIPRKVTYGPTDYRTTLADDQTPRYNANQITTDYAKVKYYGPTMGKSYAAKQNPNLIDLDTYGMPEYNQLAKKYGYKDWREMILSNKGDYNAEYKDLIKAQIRRLQTDPDNAGKTIMVSNASLLKPNSGITFANTPVIPERSIMAARNHKRHPWESIRHGEEWWDSLQAKGTPLKIDNRYVSEIEKIPYQKPTTTKDASFELEDPINSFIPEPEYSLFTPKDNFRKLNNEELIKASRSTRKFEYSPEGNAKWLESQGLEVPTNIDDLFYDRVQRLPRSRTNRERISVFDPEAMQLSINEGSRNEGYIDLEKLSKAFDEPSMGVSMYERYRKGNDGVPFTAVSFDAASRLSRLLYGRSLISGRHLLNPRSTVYNVDKYFYTEPVKFKGELLRGKFNLEDPELAARYQLALNQSTIPEKEQFKQLVESNRLLIPSGNLQIKSLPEVYDLNGKLLNTSEAERIANTYGLPNESKPGFYVQKILPRLKINFDNRVAIRHPFWHPSEQGLFGYKQGGTIE